MTDGLQLREGVTHERFQPALHWAAVPQSRDGGYRVDQPDLQPGPLRTPTSDVGAARRLKSEG